MAQEHFGVGVRDMLAPQVEQANEVWDRAQMVEAAATTKLVCGDKEAVDDFRRGVEPLLDGADGKSVGSRGGRRRRTAKGRGRRRTRSRRGQSRRAIGPPGVDGSSFRDDIRQAECSSLLEDRVVVGCEPSPTQPCMDRCLSTLTGLGSSSGQGERGLADPCLAGKSIEGRGDPGSVCRIEMDLEDPCLAGSDIEGHGDPGLVCRKQMGLEDRRLVGGDRMGRGDQDPELSTNVAGIDFSANPPIATAAVPPFSDFPAEVGEDARCLRDEGGPDGHLRPEALPKFRIPLCHINSLSFMKNLVHPRGLASLQQLVPEIKESWELACVWGDWTMDDTWGSALDGDPD